MPRPIQQREPDRISRKELLALFHEAYECRQTRYRRANALCKEHDIREYLKGGIGPAIVYDRRKAEEASRKVKPLTAAA